MSVYLFYGEETYLIDMKIKRIKKDFGEMVQGINYIQIDETNIEQLIANIETPAFGFDKKIIIVKNSGIFKKEKKTFKKTNKAETLQEKIANYILENSKEIVENIELIFIEETVEKNQLYEAINKIGKIKEFSSLKLPELIDNFKKICNAYSVELDDGTARYLVECCGTNMQDLINEVRKLIEYNGKGGKIKKEDIDKLCIKQIQAVIFDLTDNLGKKQTQNAIKVLHGLITNKEPIQKILVTLYNHFKKLYIIKIAERYHQDLVQAMNLKPNQMFLIGKYKTQASFFNTEELRRILEELINLDANYKVGLIDLETGLESILCRYCSK